MIARRSAGRPSPSRTGRSSPAPSVRCCCSTRSALRGTRAPSYCRQTAHSRPSTSSSSGRACLSDSTSCLSRALTILSPLDRPPRLFTIPATRAPLTHAFLSDSLLMLIDSAAHARQWDLATLELRRSLGAAQALASARDDGWEALPLLGAAEETGGPTVKEVLRPAGLEADDEGARRSSPFPPFSLADRAAPPSSHPTQPSRSGSTSPRSSPRPRPSRPPTRSSRPKRTPRPRASAASSRRSSAGASTAKSTRAPRRACRSSDLRRRAGGLCPACRGA